MNYRKATKADLQAEVKRLKEEVEHKNEGLRIMDGLIESLNHAKDIQAKLLTHCEAELKKYQANHERYPVIENYEREVVLMMRTHRPNELARCLEFLIDNLFYSDQLLDLDEKEKVTPLIELKHTLYGRGLLSA